MTSADYPSPQRRRLQIYSSDPLQGSSSSNVVAIEIPHEPIKIGPVGSRLAVIDYDGSRKCFYEPVELEHPSLLKSNGLRPTEGDPRFHQQMVYAVAMKVLENVDQAIGRPFYFRRKQKLKLLPHGFRGPNAFYDAKLHAVFFGYFQASKETPGRNLPGQTVFTCLSHDTIVHEVTHAILHRMKKYYLEPSNLDVLAFHEGFADIVALMQHFTYPKPLYEAIQNGQTDLRSSELLVSLARQFGEARDGSALRSALDDPSKVIYEKTWKHHDRGAILLAAVFDTFFVVYQRRIQDLLRIATGGTGVLPKGNIHPDLANRVAREAAKTAQTVLNMCIRAVDYMPPVDGTFGDYLRALVTADTDLIDEDRFDQRGALIESFRKRGIYPKDTISLSEDSVLWPQAPSLPPVKIDPEVFFLLADWTTEAKNSTDWSFENEELTQSKKKSDAVKRGRMAKTLVEYAKKHADKLMLRRDRTIRLTGFHFLTRNRGLRGVYYNLVAQFDQIYNDQRKPDPAAGGLLFRGGTTVIFDQYGKPKWIIAKPITERAIKKRISTQLGFARQCQIHDPEFGWTSNSNQNNFMINMSNIRRLHDG